MSYPTRFPRLLLALIPCLLACTATLAPGAALAAGKSQFTVATTGLPIQVFAYRPTNYTDGPLIVVMHGMNRNADDYRDNAIPLAEQFHALVIAPEFDTNRFPNEAYQRGGVTKDGTAQPRTQWTFSYLPQIVAAVRTRQQRSNLPCYFIGHSAGGQFLTRLAAFLPGDAQRIVAGNPGSHLFPTRELPFQYGFGGLPAELSNDDAIKRYLAAPLTLFLGTGDILSDNLDQTETAMKQGATRIERGRACYAAARRLATEKGWPFNWSIVEAPGIGHDSQALFAHPLARTALFTKQSVITPPSQKSPPSPATPKPSGTKQR